MGGSKNIRKFDFVKSFSGGRKFFETGKRWMIEETFEWENETNGG